MSRILAAMRGSVPALSMAALVGASAAWAEKPVITYKAPASGDDDRPVITEIVYTPQGSDYAFRLAFDKEPWGEACHTRCANATVFIDTDNDKGTGLKLGEAKAAETGADLALVISGVREMREAGAKPSLKVKVVLFGEDATTIEQGSTLAELTLEADGERLIAEGTSVYVLVDGNVGNIPSGQKARLVYHPPGAKALVGLGKGLLAGGGGTVELFKKGKLTNPPKPRK